MPFAFNKLRIADILVIDAKPFSDNRGYFMEIFQCTSFANNGIDTKFVQDNFSHSVKGVLRGLHYQKNPCAQAKLVTTLHGEIFDVAVDIRKNSRTYGQWVGEILSSTNHKMLYIPEGFAHGFCVMSDEADVLYKVTNEYSPEHEKGIIWNDSTINISWPTSNPILSKKDLELPSLHDVDNNF